MSADRILHLARELRMAALGAGGNPPGVSRYGLAALGGRITTLAETLPPDWRADLEGSAARLKAQDAGLTAEETLFLAKHLEEAARVAETVVVRPAPRGTSHGGGDAA